MRRSAVAVVALAVVALCATGCSSSPDQVTASMTSPPRPAASELAPEDDLSGSIDDFTEEFGELPEEFSEGLDDFGTGIDDMLEQFESELGLAGECLDLLVKYSELMGSLMSGGSDRETVVAELKAALPADLHDELQIVSDTMATIEREGLSGAGALTDPAFLDANNAIVAQLQNCDAAGTTPGEGA